MNDMTLTDKRLAILNVLVTRQKQIESALKHSDEGWTFQHVFEGVATGKLSFWFNESSCAILELRMMPARPVLHVFLGAGTQEGLFSLFEDVKTWASPNGVTQMTTQCRKGFANRLKKAGWQQKRLWMEIEL